MQENFEHRYNQACLDGEHRKDIMDIFRCIATREISHAQPETSAYEDRLPFGTNGNNGNNTPPRSPRQPLTAPPSPPRHPPSHHEEEANDEISSEELMRFKQDDVAQCLMLKILKCNGDQYFQYMISRGYNLPPSNDVQKNFQERVPTKFEILREELQQTFQRLAQLAIDKEPTKVSFVDSICALPFDRSLYMVPFPRDIEVLTYDKYDQNGDPHDHVCHFYTLSIDFIHEDAYLLSFFLEV